MPDLQSYRRLAPFTADELIESANALLRRRPGQEISKRTLRYYITEGVVPPPTGPAKFSRYGYEHLVAVLAVRALQDLGTSLERIRVETEELQRGHMDRLSRLVEGWLSGRATPRPVAIAAPAAPPAPAMAPRLQTPDAAVPPPPIADPRSRSTPAVSRVVRVALTEHSVLEVSGDRPLEEEMPRCLARLQELVRETDIDS
jgi:DNA-binding transcriptional MerR regulator